jgi:hypothetical protein
VGYFQGKKGLQQGDPNSPYLFVLAMEGFSLLLEDMARSNPLFCFYPKCSPIQLTHLCFADDLLIFSAASLESMSAIKGVLDEFENLSRLWLILLRVCLFIFFIYFFFLCWDFCSCQEGVVGFSRQSGRCSPGSILGCYPYF